MADSIAKLSVIIVGDASPLEATLGRVQSDLERFGVGFSAMSKLSAKTWDAFINKVKTSLPTPAANPFEQLTLGAHRAARGMDEASRSSARFSTVLGAMRGNLNAAFMIGGPAALGIAAMVLSVKKLADAGDALM